MKVLSTFDMSLLVATVRMVSTARWTIWLTLARRPWHDSGNPLQPHQPTRPSPSPTPNLSLTFIVVRNLLAIMRFARSNI